MATKKLKSIKGRVVRVTRLDQCGLPVYGEGGYVVSKGFITVTLGNEYETGEELQQKNAWGEYCVNDKDPDITKWVNVSVQFCEVDPTVLDIIGGANPVVVGDDTIGATFGQPSTTEAFAIEVWTKKSGQDACVGGTVEWGYFVVPFVKNGKLDGDVKIENAPLNVTLVGEGFGAPATWGMGPHMDEPMKASFPAGDFWGLVVTNVQPPAETAGAVELYGPITAVQAGDIYPAEPTITAESAPMAALLTGLGYIASPATAWGTGEFFTIGTYRFNWSGSAWAAGIHA
jgi:hypothetical protein